MPTIKKPLTIGDILKSEADRLSRVAITVSGDVKAGAEVLYEPRNQRLIALTDAQHGKVLVQPHNCVINLDVINKQTLTDAGVTAEQLVSQGDTYGIKYIGMPYVDVTEQATPALTVGVVGTDGVIDATEDDTDVTISGTATDIADATAVSVEVNSKTYTGTVTNNTWSVTMPSADAQALPEDAAQTITVTATVDGNAVTATGTVTHNAVA